jgi:hypothetical protein
MCLRFLFLLITRLAGWLRLSRREETWKTAEILILRHQLAVLQRRQPRRPKLNWADRAPLATLLGVIPKAPPRAAAAGTATSSAAAGPPAPCAARPAGHPQEHQGPGHPAGLGESRVGLPQDPRGAGRPGSACLGVAGVGDLEEGQNRPSTAADRANLVAVPASSGRGDTGMRLLHGRPARPHQVIAQRVPGDGRDAPHATVINIDRQQIRRKPVLAA